MLALCAVLRFGLYVFPKISVLLYLLSWIINLCFLIVIILYIRYRSFFLNLCIMSKEQFDFIRRLADMVSCFTDNLSLPVCLFIACQSALESSFGTSRRAVEDCNYFGMKKPTRRLGVYLDTSDPFCVYESKEISVLDYLFWLAYSRPSKVEMDSIDAYAKFLVRKNYCPDSDYIRRIRRIYDNYISVKQTKVYEK